MDLKTYITDSERGTAKQLADSLGVSRSFLSQMAAGSAPISPARAVQIEKETSGKVTRKEMYPDDWHLIWPELVDVA
jgi:DNA-binding transcriptional regulator YdaS (Cro superfamily)